jgi:hypothetical protein
VTLGISFPRQFELPDKSNTHNYNESKSQNMLLLDIIIARKLNILKWPNTSSSSENSYLNVGTPGDFESEVSAT